VCLSLATCCSLGLTVFLIAGDTESDGNQTAGPSSKKPKVDAEETGSTSSVLLESQFEDFELQLATWRYGFSSPPAALINPWSKIEQS
jgi:hypothetical protein